MLILSQMKNIFSVSYSTQIDLKNYLDQTFYRDKYVSYGEDIVELGSRYFPKTFLQSLVDAKSKTIAKKYITDFWKSKRNSSFNYGNKLLCKWYERILNEEKASIIKPLEKKYQSPFPFTDIKVYLTTFFSCPYFYPKYFMMYRNCSIFDLINTAKHELNHFMFYYYFDKKLAKKYTLNQREILKEALAVLTGSLNENTDKPKVLSLQKFIQENSHEPVDKIIKLVIKNKLLENIK